MVQPGFDCPVAKCALNSSETGIQIIPEDLSPRQTRSRFEAWLFIVSPRNRQTLRLADHPIMRKKCGRGVIFFVARWYFGPFWAAWMPTPARARRPPPRDHHRTAVIPSERRLDA